MQIRKLIFVVSLFIGVSTLHAQTSWQPDKKELFASIGFLSSPLLEGREAGEKGCFIAAEYIASMMEMYGLEPMGDRQTYFQDFNILRNKSGNYELTLISSQNSTTLMDGVDFTVRDVTRSFNLEASTVFAGYGLSFPENGYDSYKGVDVKGKIVIVVNGSPELPSDITSAQYKTLKAIKEKDISIEAKQKMAAQHGAVAMLVVNLKGDLRSNNAVNSLLINESSHGKIFPAYTDADYTLTSDGISQQLPCFELSKHASKLLFVNDIIELMEIDNRLEKSGVSSVPIKFVKVRLAANVESEAVRVRNVLGMVKGVDTTKYILFTAHYDHLGRRGNAIYSGADDNASGVSGLLSIAKYWSQKSEKPACNIIFATWTAEEKGMLGSRYFVQNFSNVKQDVLLNINFDMISRPDTEDPENKILYVGLLKGRKNLRDITEQNNAKLSKPFILDPWETDGNGGSDYIAFSALHIPVIAFFSGMHDDYHLPLDTKDKIDMDRMIRIVTLANSCLTQFLQEIK